MDEAETIREAQRLLKRWDNLRIVGSKGEWSGSARQGFMFNPKRRGGSQATPLVGSCCIGTGFWYGSCFDGYTRAQCEDDPTVQGVWHPEPCDAGVNCVFACCHDGICTDETEAHCRAIGGTFFNTNTFCTDDPPPDCSLPPTCPEGGVNVDLSDFPISCVCFFNAPNYEHWDISGIPTSFTMLYDIGIGAWRADFPGGLILNYYSNSSCSSHSGGPFSVDAIAIFNCDVFGSGTFQFTINNRVGGGSFMFFAQGSYIGTSAIAVNDRCCPSEVGCINGGIATGGTALLTW